MHSPMKQYDIVKTIKENRKLIIIIASAFFSSVSFFVSQVICELGGSEKVGSIVSSILFWLFLIIEVILFVTFKVKTNLNDAGAKSKQKHFCLGAIISFAVLLSGFIISVMATSGSVSVINMFLLSFSLFSFHMIFIFKSKAFRNLLLKGKEKLQ